MEDLYDDLDNYDNVNAVQELRHENMELKVKLEEHSAAMEKLQKEYDTLEIEFKKLENNYSSLLKTARAELERKTQRITQLSIEKDAMVLNSLKNGKRIRRDFSKGVQNTTNFNNAPAKGKDNKKVEKRKDGGSKKNEAETKIERCDTTNSQAKNEVPSMGSDKKSINPENTPKTEGGKSNNKENVDAPRSIKDRRKSMPVLSMQLEKFSSEDEFDHNYPTATHSRTDIPPNDSFDRRNVNKHSYDRHNTMNGETSSIEDRNSNFQESVKENHRNKNSKNYDYNHYRGKDKYEVSLRYRKRYSPERGQKRHHREYQEDYYGQDHGRYRQRDHSPPLEAYHPHQRRHPTHRDSRSNYDRYSHEYDNYRYHSDEKHSSKHRISNDFDEPHSKRQKTDSFSNPDPYYNQGKRYYSDKESMNIQSIPENSQHEYDALRTSCQSPDYVHNEIAHAHPVKEIMATASTPLDDPRITSKRYKLKKENGKETLIVAEGRMIDIVPIDKAKWGCTSVPIPDALVRRPSQCDDDMIQELYTNIDYSESDQALELGELPNYVDIDHNTNNMILKTDTLPHLTDNNKEKVIEDVVIPLIKPGEIIPSVYNATTKKLPKIPKIKTQNKTDMTEKITAEGDFCKKIQTEKNLKEPKKTLHSNINGKHENDNKYQTILSNIAIVADDLEMSDENSDHKDLPKKVETKKKSSKVHSESNTKVIRNEESRNYKQNKTHADHSKKAEKSEANEVKASNDSTKFVKDKKKNEKSKSKEVSSKVKDKISTVSDLGAENNTIPKKDKESKSGKHTSAAEENKNKFSDLFGDSTSLMTPEDLGIPSYLPISEDAQDAVDLQIDKIIDSPILAPSIVVNKSGEISVTDSDEKIKSQKDGNIISKIVTFKDDKEIKDKKKKNKPKHKEDTFTSKEISPAEGYININPESDTHTSDIVKTVIISEGVQPQLSLHKDDNPKIGKPVDETELNLKENVICKKQIPLIIDKKQEIIKALATSTPLKEITALKPIEPNTKSIDNQDSNIVNTKDNMSPGITDQSGTSSFDAHDAPDVRIFVKRRRKTMKRPPMT